MRFDTYPNCLEADTYRHFLTGSRYIQTAYKVSFCILICVFLKPDTPPNIVPISSKSCCREHGLLDHDFSKGSPASVSNPRSATLLQLSLPLAGEDSLIQQMLPECPSEMEQEQLQRFLSPIYYVTAITEIFLPAGAHLNEDLESR